MQFSPEVITSLLIVTIRFCEVTVSQLPYEWAERRQFTKHAAVEALCTLATQYAVGVARLRTVWQAVLALGAVKFSQGP